MTFFLLLFFSFSLIHILFAAYSIRFTFGNDIIPASCLYMRNLIGADLAFFFCLLFYFFGGIRLFLQLLLFVVVVVAVTIGQSACWDLPWLILLAPEVLAKLICA